MSFELSDFNHKCDYCSLPAIVQVDAVYFCRKHLNLAVDMIQEDPGLLKKKTKQS